MKLHQLKPWIWLSLLLLVLITATYFSFSKEPEVYPDYVSESASPSGIKAIYTYLNKEAEAKRWLHSPDLLPKSGDHLLIMVEPTFLIKQSEFDEYIKFLQAGNTILVFQSNTINLFGFETVKVTENEPQVSIRNQQEQTFNAKVLAPIRLAPEKNDTVLLSDELGAVAVKRTIGNGEVIVSVATEWMMNSHLLSYDHIELISQLINESSASHVLVDDFIHYGYDADGGLAVYPKWLLLILLQAVVITILWLWSRGKRFGAILEPREESVRFSDEGIQALTAWYVRVRRYQDSLHIQADYVKLALQERWGISYNREWKELTGFLERKWQKKSSGEIQTFLHDLTLILAKEKLTKQEYLLWSRNLDQLRKEVEEG